MEKKSRYAKLNKLVKTWYGYEYTLGAIRESDFSVLLEGYVTGFTDEEKRKIFENYYLDKENKIRPIGRTSQYVYLHHARVIMKHVLGKQGKSEVLAMCSRRNGAVQQIPARSV